MSFTVVRAKVQEVSFSLADGDLFFLKPDHIGRTERFVQLDLQGAAHTHPHGRNQEEEGRGYGQG